MTKKEKSKKLQILFVCYGNICRSPIAEGLTNFHYIEKVQAESAGIAAHPNEPAFPDSVIAMKETYGIDISSHKARHIDDITINGFDYIIAMDSMVYEGLLKMKNISQDTLYGWDIADPLGLGPYAFIDAAKRIKKRIDQFFVNRGLV